MRKTYINLQQIQQKSIKWLLDGLIIMKVNLFDLLDIYESEVKKNVRNKKKILDFEKHKMEYLVDIKKNARK